MQFGIRKLCRPSKFEPPVICTPAELYEYTAKFDYDLDAIYEDNKNQNKKSWRKIVYLPSKKINKLSVEKFL